MGKIFILVTGVDQWKQLLADPDKRWRTGYPARTLAHCCQEASGFPPSVQTVFAGCEAIDPTLIRWSGGLFDC